MTLSTRLLWWLITCLSFLLLYYAVLSGFAERVFERDFTFISLGLTIAYLFLTAWIGLAIHTRLPFPLRPARYFSHEATQIGLIGTVIGIAFLFGLDGPAAEIDEQHILSGVGTAIFTTLAGAIWGAFLHIQLIVLGHEA